MTYVKPQNNRGDAARRHQGDHSMNENGKAGGPSTRSRSQSVHETDHGQGLSHHTQKRIGVHLRAMYDTIVQQPVPDRFRDLIAKLESADHRS